METKKVKFVSSGPEKATINGYSFVHNEYYDYQDWMSEKRFRPNFVILETPESKEKQLLQEKPEVKQDEVVDAPVVDEQTEQQEDILEEELEGQLQEELEKETDDVPEQLSQYEMVHKGRGRWIVIDLVSGKEVNDEYLDKQEAKELLEKLN